MRSSYLSSDISLSRLWPPTIKASASVSIFRRYAKSKSSFDNVPFDETQQATNRFDSFFSNSASKICNFCPIVSGRDLICSMKASL